MNDAVDAEGMERSLKIWFTSILTFIQTLNDLKKEYCQLFSKEIKALITLSIELMKLMSSLGQVGKFDFR